MIEIGPVVGLGVGSEKSDHGFLLPGGKRQDSFGNGAALLLYLSQLVFCIGAYAHEPEPAEGEVHEEVLVIEAERAVVEGDVAPVGGAYQKGSMPEPGIEGLAVGNGQKGDLAAFPE